MRKKFIFLILSWLVLSWLSLAQAASPNQFVYEGYLTDASGNASNGSLTFKFEIYDPNGTCLLYSENQTLTVTNGNFSAAIGAGTRNSGDPGLTMTQVFNNQNGSTITGASSCIYSVVSKDNRLLRVTVGSETLTPDIAVNSVPFANFADNSDHAAMADSATNATTLNGKADTAFAQINANTTQSKLDSFFTGSTASQVTNLVNGATATNTGALTLPVGTTTQQPSSPVQGMIRYNTTSSQTEVYNGSAWTAVGGATGSYLALSGGAMSGPIDMSSNSINNISSTNIGVASIASATITAPIATTKPLVVKAATAQTANLFEVQNSSGSVLAQIPATGVPSFSGDLTTKSYVDNANTNQDATIAVKVAKAGDTMSGNLIMGSHSQVRYGDSGSNYVALQAPTTMSSSYTLTLPSSVTAGAYLTTDGSGNLSWGTPSGGGTGTVQSVALSVPNIFSVSGSPVTSTGTMTMSLNNQTQNTIFAGPTGGSGAPSFRALTATDIPSLDASKIGSGVLPVTNGGTNSSAALNNNRIMVSSSGQIVENAALTANRVMLTNASGLPISSASSVTDTNLQWLANVSVSSPTSGQVLQYNGAQWVSATPTTTVPGGTAGYVQFNNGGTFAGSSNLFWDNTNNRLGIGTMSPAYDITVSKSVPSGNVTYSLDNTSPTGAAWARVASNVSGTQGSLLLGVLGSSYSAGAGVYGAGAASIYADQFTPNGIYLGTEAVGAPVRFYTGNVFRGIIDGNGNYGISTASPVAKLDVVSTNTSQPTVRVLATTSQTSPIIDIRDSNSNSAFNVIQATPYDYVKIGDTSYLTLGNLPSPTGSVATGAMYYDTTDQLLHYANGSASPRQAVQPASVFNASTTNIDFAAGSTQVFISMSCISTFNLQNMAIGVTYNIVFQSADGNTCTFASSGATFKYSPANGPTIPSKDAVYSFLRVNSSLVYVNWSAGY